MQSPPVHHIREWREARNLTVAQLADAVGRDKSLISKLERGQSGLTDSVLKGIAEALHVAPAALFELPPDGTTPIVDGAPITLGSVRLATQVRAGPGFDVDETMPPPQRLPRDIPVMGTAAGAVAGAFQLTDGPVDWVRRPPGLVSMPDIYAIYVVGDSMEPEHRDGDLRFVHPGRAPQPSDSVLIQTRNGEEEAPQTYIKNLVRRGSSRVAVRQWNPATTMEFETRQIEFIHKILTTAELFAI